MSAYYQHCNHCGRPTHNSDICTDCEHKFKTRIPPPRPHVITIRELKEPESVPPRDTENK